MKVSYVFTKITEGDLNFVKKVVFDRPENIDLADSHGTTLLMIAARHGQLAICKFLVEGYKKGNRKFRADVNSRCKLGWTALHYAAYNGREEICKCLVPDTITNMDVQSESGDTPLHGAAMRDNKKLFKFFIDNGANPHLKNMRNETAMDIFIENEWHGMDCL